MSVRILMTLIQLPVSVKSSASTCRHADRPEPLRRRWRAGPFHWPVAKPGAAAPDQGWLSPQRPPGAGAPETSRDSAFPEVSGAPSVASNQSDKSAKWACALGDKSAKRSEAVSIVPMVWSYLLDESTVPRRLHYRHG